MSQFYTPALDNNSEDPFIRDANNRLVRRSYWLDMSDPTVVLVMVNGIGAHIPNDQKRAHLEDIGRGHLVKEICIQEILPPEK
ncbi:MAG: hypothetical protein CBB68_00360 [Rhodospirillaceae bacterium TMED8]|nr:hypothetical protein [Magnetovibrio sp.]OUT53340.1 MAG: hypothetical protein CBB68_00360 [Rhodospirillaceae bacterium TMED8]|tara:strand:+ start:8323 stop:8571 length:249 start_codon:yes stop_codon:yes gene_type:complete